VWRLTLELSGGVAVRLDDLLDDHSLWAGHFIGFISVGDLMR
jgi:hypothetical protein